MSAPCHACRRSCSPPRASFPLRALESRGYTNLVARFAGTAGYSHRFRGEAGNLGHALATSPLAARVKALHAWHIDAEAPIALQSAPDYKTPAQRAACYAPDACRSSDHDAVVIDLALDDSAA